MDTKPLIVLLPRGRDLTKVIKVCNRAELNQSKRKLFRTLISEIYELHETETQDF